MEYLSEAEERPDLDMALIIDGRCLMYALDPNKLRTTLLKLSMMCKAVVCCRVSPLQKAQVFGNYITNVLVIFMIMLNLFVDLICLIDIVSCSI